VEIITVTITTISSREFNQDVSRAKRASASGPVFITDRGHTAHVLLTIKEYQAITDQKDSIIELLAMPEAAEIEFEPARVSKELYRPADFS
jgi:PHD/YefM family antitoxin component YafN of YafNO toxin-antitoxin module